METPMSSLLGGFFDTEGFMPHGYCLLWKPEVFWLNLVSDAIIALSYYSIPFVLVYFALRRRDLAFRWMFVMFGIFILGCGTTHDRRSASEPQRRTPATQRLMPRTGREPTGLCQGPQGRCVPKSDPCDAAIPWRRRAAQSAANAHRDLLRPRAPFVGHPKVCAVVLADGVGARGRHGAPRRCASN
jgi:hypothetical protein